jgi:hypothetical protein
VYCERDPDDLPARRIRFAKLARRSKMASAMLWALSWEQICDDPIELPDGRLLRTLPNAVEFIEELPKATHDRSEWQAAIEALLLVVDHDGDTLLAHIAIKRALNAGSRPIEPEPRRKLVKRHRVVRGIARSPQKPKLR